MEIRIFAADLTEYNMGFIEGEWFTLPVDDIQTDIIDKVLTLPEHEYFIADYEADGFNPSVLNGFDLEQLNSLAIELDKFDSLTELYFSLDENFLDIYEFSDEMIRDLYPDPVNAFNAATYADIKPGAEWMTFDGYGRIETIIDLDNWLDDYAGDIVDQFATEYAI